jgi:hypothetical protein
VPLGHARGGFAEEHGRAETASEAQAEAQAEAETETLAGAAHAIGDLEHRLLVEPAAEEGDLRAGEGLRRRRGRSRGRHARLRHQEGSAAKTSPACASGFTRRITFVTLPSGSMMKVERSIPIFFCPYAFFSTQTP